VVSIPPVKHIIDAQAWITADKAIRKSRAVRTLW
jgi:hypothetical protein